MNRNGIVVALAALALAGGCVNRQAQKTAAETEKIVSDPVALVSTQPAQTRTMREFAEITGQIATGDESQVGAKAAGRVQAVYVQDGSRVRTGQVLAIQDTSVQQAQLRQALAGVQSAQANLVQTTRNANISPRRTAAAVAQARAQVRAAQANLQKAVAGARPQERRQAEAQVTQARENLETQRTELRRIRTLVEAGAIARNRQDQQENVTVQAETALQNAQQALSLIREGTRREDITTAREQVRQAQEGLQTALANQALDTTLQDQVNAARAQVESARAQVDQIRQQIADATIRAPFDGQVSGNPAQVGTVLAPGSPLLTLVAGGGSYFEGQLPETLVGQVRPGTAVQVRIEALGRGYNGRIASIAPIGSEFGRQFSARIVLSGAGPEVRPGLFAIGTVILRQVPGATAVPTVALVRRDNKDVVFTVNNGTARRVEVRRGITEGTLVQVSGIDPGTPVVTAGQEGLDEGSKIRTQRPAESGAPAQAGGASETDTEQKGA